MEKKDPSLEIYRVFGTKRQAARVELTDGRVLEGFFVGFYHGEADWGEPYIIRWRFIPSAEMNERYLPGISPSQGIIIKQRSIQEVSSIKAQTEET